MNFVKPMPRGEPANREPFVVEPPAQITQKKPIAPSQPSARPHGFYKVSTEHFDVFMENSPPPQSLLETLENLHSNLMLDLQPFVEHNGAVKVSIYIFKNKDTYRDVTGRPEWSGGASSVPERKIYIYESRGFTGILAHEMCHIYYDGFLISAAPMIRYGSARGWRRLSKSREAWPLRIGSSPIFRFWATAADTVLRI